MTKMNLQYRAVIPVLYMYCMYYTRTVLLLLPVSNDTQDLAGHTNLTNPTNP